MFKQQNINIGGSTEPGFESVKKVFKDNFTGGSAQLCVVKNGKIVSFTYILHKWVFFDLSINIWQDCRPVGVSERPWLWRGQPANHLELHQEPDRPGDGHAGGQGATQLRGQGHQALAGVRQGAEGERRGIDM